MVLVKSLKRLLELAGQRKADAAMMVGLPALRIEFDRRVEILHGFAVQLPADVGLSGGVGLGGLLHVRFAAPVQDPRLQIGQVLVQLRSVARPCSDRPA